MPHFQHVEFLYLLILIPVFAGLFMYALYKKKAAARKIGDAGLVKILTAGFNKSAYLVKFLLILSAASLIVLALANLRKATGSEKVNRNGIDIMIALDVSKSMLASDIKPDRLTRAKQVLSRLVDKLDNDRIGIVLFAGKSYLQMPLTGDHSAAKMYLSAATTETVPTQGTVIGDALKMCFASFNANEKKYKAVVLISDGEDHDEAATKIAGQMAQEGVIIYTVGIGSPQGSVIIDAATSQVKTDNEGNAVISKLNETVLRDVAEKGNGKYILFQNTDAVVNTIGAELAGMDQRTVTDDSLVNYRSFFMYFLLAAFLFLVIELFLSENKRKRGINMKPAMTLLFIFSISVASAQSADEKKAIKQGNEAYKNGEYDKASGSYQEVIKKNPDNATAQFNNGNALYKSDKKEESVKAYDNAINLFGTAAEKSNAYYNKGVVLQNEKKLPECIEAYKQALKLDPSNEDARQNLQKALQQQKQQQQQKQDQKQEKKKQDQQQNQDKQKEPKPQPSKLTRKDAEEKLKALMQQEKNLQDKLHKINPATVTKPEKDW